MDFRVPASIPLPLISPLGQGMEAFGLGPRFVVPALAGPGLTLGALLTVKPGPAEAGTTNDAGTWMTV